ncbi:pectin acetylesterase-family hydrolase [Desertimonas flava]|uniref:pectin acetylesterase-family hydrolase n=1 Tax=Desertimonas flava TaxID=2064846 RepID=UPI000E341754|nr:pectin acetylesterase-family hydrolase [Desertimonas flava]
MIPRRILLLIACTSLFALAAAVPAASAAEAGETSTPPDSPPPGADELLDAAFEYAQCLRDNGIDDYPDPRTDGGGLEISSPLDLNTHTNEEVAVAQSVCEPILASAAPPVEPPPDAGGGGGAGADGGPSEWEAITPGGDCECADGSEFTFWDRDADPTRVVLYLDGGGACTDALTCAFTGSNGESDFYTWSIGGKDPGFPGRGILDLDHADNPFAEHSFVFVGSCTGDADLGDSTHEYSPDLTVEHNGFVNGSAAIDHLAEHFPDATQVVVVGNTGGSVSAPLYGGLVADRLPDAEVIVIGAGSGHWPDDPDLNVAVLDELWGAYGNMPDWDVNEGLTAGEWGIPRFWIQAGLHDPGIVMARFDFAYDPNAGRALESLGLDGTTLGNIDANDAAIEAAGVDLHTFTAAGDGHRVLERDDFYVLEEGGVTLVEWLAALLAGDPLDDVRCVDCAAPS